MEKSMDGWEAQVSLVAMCGVVHSITNIFLLLLSGGVRRLTIFAVPQRDNNCKLWWYYWYDGLSGDGFGASIHWKCLKSLSCLFRSILVPSVALAQLHCLLWPSGKDGSVKKTVVDKDEGPRPGVTAESLGKLKPAASTAFWLMGTHSFCLKIAGFPVAMMDGWFRDISKYELVDRTEAAALKCPSNHTSIRRAGRLHFLNCGGNIWAPAMLDNITTHPIFVLSLDVTPLKTNYFGYSMRVSFPAVWWYSDSLKHEDTRTPYAVRESPVLSPPFLRPSRLVAALLLATAARWQMELPWCSWPGRTVGSFFFCVIP